MGWRERQRQVDQMMRSYYMPSAFVPARRWCCNEEVCGDWHIRDVNNEQPQTPPKHPCCAGTLFEDDGSEAIHFLILLYRPNDQWNAKLSYRRLSASKQHDLQAGEAILEGTIRKLSHKAHETRKRRYDYSDLSLQTIVLPMGRKQTLRTRAWKDIRQQLRSMCSTIRTSDLTSIVERVVFNPA